MKERKDGFLRELEGKHAACKVWMAIKSLLVALPFLLIALFIFGLWMLWLSEGPPDTWRTETVRYARMDRRLSLSSRGMTNYIYVLITTDGREFVVHDRLASDLEEALTYGAVCEITHHKRLGSNTTCGLISGERVFIDLAEKEAQWYSDRVAFPRYVLIWLGLSVLAASLGYIFWCRKDREELARIRERIRVREEKNAIRAERRAGKLS